MLSIAKHLYDYLKDSSLSLRATYHEGVDGKGLEEKK
jgi:hypothetical protein